MGSGFRSAIASPRASNNRRMRTLHTGIRVTDPAVSLAFYSALGYTVVGRVPGTSIGSLTMLKLPGDEFVTLELVHDPERGEVMVGTGFNHLVVQVDDLEAVRSTLNAAGIAVESPHLPGGPEGPITAWLTDPDSYRIELTQWPAGHPVGMSAEDFST